MKYRNSSLNTIKKMAKEEEKVILAEITELIKKGTIYQIRLMYRNQKWIPVYALVKREIQWAKVRYITIWKNGIILWKKNPWYMTALYKHLKFYDKTDLQIFDDGRKSMELRFNLTKEEIDGFMVQNIRFI